MEVVTNAGAAWTPAPPSPEPEAPEAELASAHADRAESVVTSNAASEEPTGKPMAAPRVTTSNPFATLSAVKAEIAARPQPPVVTEEMLEDIVSRVLQRLSDKVVRETVTEIVTQTAERLVQEEIERIKSTEP